MTRPDGKLFVFQQIAMPPNTRKSKLIGWVNKS
jgi:hypothetical protein